MTKAEIIAELRRSAVSDRYPWAGVNGYVFGEMCKYKTQEGEMVCNLSDGNCRTFFLLVACAMESECAGPQK